MGVFMIIKIKKCFIVLLCSVLVFVSVSSVCTRKTYGVYAETLLGIGGTVALLGWLYATYCGTQSSQFTINDIGQFVYDEMGEMAQQSLQQLKIRANGQIIIPAALFDLVKTGINQTLIKLLNKDGSLGGSYLSSTLYNDYLVGSPRYGINSSNFREWFEFDGVCFVCKYGSRYYWYFASTEPFQLDNYYDKKDGSTGHIYFISSFDTARNLYVYSVQNTIKPIDNLYNDYVSNFDFYDTLISVNQDGVIGWDNEEDEQKALDGFNDIPVVGENGSVSVLNPDISTPLEMEKFLENVGTLEYTDALDIPNVGVIDNDLDDIENPDIDIPDGWELGDYVISGITEFFPFCIPFDLYYILTVFNAEPEPIKFDYKMSFGGVFEDYTISVDLTPFETVALIFRVMIFLIFLIFLTLKTRDLIRG